MKKIITIITGLLIAFIIFLIYEKRDTRQIVYLALGDSLTQGVTPYGNVNYSYADYLAEYFNNNKLLKFYTKDFSDKNYSVADIINQINNNTSINNKEQSIYIKELLRSSDIVTITIGFDNYVEYTNKLTQSDDIYKKINEVSLDLSNLVKLVKKYSKGQIILIGYYNPTPNIKQNKYINYSDKVFSQLCKENDINFIKISDIFNQKSIYFSNPLDMHPNSSGYRAIANKIISFIEKNP